MQREARRRTVLRAAGGALALGGLAGTSGCLGVITGAEPIELSASVATVPEAALSSTGFEEYRVRPLETRRAFSAAGETREVVVVNRLAEYDDAVEVFGQRLRAAVFAALATPAVEVAGETFNPVGDLSTRELAERLLTRYEGVGNLQSAGSETVRVLGTDTTAGLFTAEATVAGGVTTDVTLHVSEAVRAGADFVVAVGSYPSVLTGREDDVRTLMGSLVHDSAST